jgi:hypothetical protein
LAYRRIKIPPQQTDYIAIDVDAHCHARNEKSYTYIRENDDVVSHLLLYEWGDISHIGIYDTAETDNGYARTGVIAYGYEIEHHHIYDAARSGFQALMQHPKVDGSMEDVLMEEWVGKSVQHRATFIETHPIVTKECDTHYYNVPSIKRNLFFLNS